MDKSVATALVKPGSWYRLKLRFLWSCAVISWAIWHPHADIAHADADIAEFAAKACASARSLSTIDCQFQHEGIGYFCRYMQDGTKFREELWNKGTFGQPDQHPASVQAFDGDKYYQMKGDVFIAGADASTTRLSVSSNPLLVMYRWLLFSANSTTWAPVSDLDAWTSALSTAQIIGDEDAAGVPCRKVFVDFEKGRVIVWFAADLGYVPMKWRSLLRETGELLSEAIVVRYKSIDTPVGRVALPIATNYQQEARGPARKLSYHATIDEQSLRVNEPLDPALFTVVPTQTSRVVDPNDRKNRDVPAKESEPGPQKARWWLVIANVIGIIVLVGLIARAAMIRRRQATGELRV